MPVTVKQIKFHDTSGGTLNAAPDHNNSPGLRPERPVVRQFPVPGQIYGEER